MEELIYKIREMWIRQGIPVLPGLSNERIQEVEHSFGIRLPRDMRFFYSVLNGMGPRTEWDDRLNSIWSLECLTPCYALRDRTGLDEHIINDLRNMYIFGDQSIGVSYFCIQLNKNNNILLFSDHSLWPTYSILCKNFRDFLTMYVYNQDSLP